MGIHREVFQVHGAFCSYCEPREIHSDMDSELEKESKENRAFGEARRSESMVTVMVKAQE